MNKVILLIPYFNNPKGLYTSLKSINKEEELDILIVDDGSTIKFDEVICKSSFLAKGDVYFNSLEVNKGIEHALNLGLKTILNKEYKYIARLDCGDICARDRFLKQVSFLERNSDISLIGSNVNFMNSKGEFLYKLITPSKDKVIRKKMYINAMHIHPSIMFRSEILNEIGLYPTKYKAAEDYAFFFNIIKKFKVANINEELVTCELSSSGISTVLRKIQAKNRIQIILDNFYFGFYPVYGLLRSILLYILPLNLLIKLKTIFKR